MKNNLNEILNKKFENISEDEIIRYINYILDEIDEFKNDNNAIKDEKDKNIISENEKIDDNKDTEDNKSRSDEDIDLNNKKDNNNNCFKIPLKKELKSKRKEI